MATAPAAQTTPEVASGATRSFLVRSCVLRPEDLRRLYSLLDRRAKEAADLNVSLLIKQAGQTDEQFERVREYARSLMQLVVTTQSSDGAWARAVGSGIIGDSSLPDSLSGVVFDSAFKHREQMKTAPANQVTVTLDFGRTGILDLTNLTLSPEPNKSSVLIAGLNDTWVKALHDDLRKFFDERASSRAWLHSRYTYEVLVPLLGIPLSLDLVYHLSHWFGPALNSSWVLAVPVYLVVFLYGLLGFRILFNYVRWVFPKVEGPSRNSRPGLHRTFIVLMGAGILSFILDGLLRAISFLR